MKNEPRIFIGDHLFYLDSISEKLINCGNADCELHSENLSQDKHHCWGYLNSQGRLVCEKSSERFTIFKIPKKLIKHGYEEGGEFARNFNLRFAESFGIRLVDKRILEKISK